VISFHVFQMGLFVILACAIMAPLPGCWRICQRAGWPGGMSLLIVIPVVNAVAIFLLAHSRRDQFSAALHRSNDPNPAIHYPAQHSSSSAKLMSGVPY
jgi:hypothetical protein